MAKKKNTRKLEGGTEDYWDDDINSKEDDEWAANVRKMFKKSDSKLKQLSNRLKQRRK